ncbi:hypothetical protein Hamer_G022977 [Homarus americanus]|uniref:Uncharacterized protein n=1 Tax=Homarus americanus TaxID=6706 RepID=A0A8J5K646_HOMAM|nr:hypothetical protein Hamer_G022977 [Homarus americanus]
MYIQSVVVVLAGVLTLTSGLGIDKDKLGILDSSNTNVQKPGLSLGSNGKGKEAYINFNIGSNKKNLQSEPGSVSDTEQTKDSLSKALDFIIELKLGFLKLRE